MKLWAIVKTILTIVIVWSIARIIMQFLYRRPQSASKPNQPKSAKTVDLKEKGKGTLPDGSEYIEYEDV